METRRIPHTDLSVSVLGMGTMTFGEQNSEAEGHAQLDMAIDHGVNFIDTAEMYPVPPRKATYGETERIVGTWLKARDCREQVILATKAAGPGDSFRYIRDGELRFNRAHLTEALDASLKRLQTDHIDLYQLHWPERSTTCFGQRDYPWKTEQDLTPLRESLEVLSDFQRLGKVRHVGISNETPWGAMTWLRLAQEHGLPRMVTVQNPYNLLNRSFDTGLSEVAHHEDLRLLAYSPLAFGKLSGKYLNGVRPAGARLTEFPRFKRYEKAAAEQAVQAYVKIARQAGLNPAQMALAFVNTRPHLASNLIGATTLEQLESNLRSADLPLSDDVLASIDKIHERFPNPCP